MAERTVTQADALGMIAMALLAVTVIVAATFVITGLTGQSTPPPAAAVTGAAAPAGDVPAAN